MLKIEKRRCFNIKKENLNLLLTALDVNFTSSRTFRPEASWIFQDADLLRYDVVLSYYGGDPYMEKKLEEFIYEMETENEN